MKRIQILLTVVVLTDMLACSKYQAKISPLASITVVNATVNLGAIKTNISGAASTEYYSGLSTNVGYGANSVYGLLARVPVSLKVIVATDSTKPILSTTFSANNGDIYSLYFSGQSTAIDTLFVKETIPTYSDSVFGVRFINLSYNSNPITINQTATPTVFDFSNVAYKQVAAFKKYPALYANTAISFQIRDGVTNAVLGTYVLTPARFVNVTLAWIGQAGGAGAIAQKIVRINNY